MTKQQRNQQRDEHLDALATEGSKKMQDNVRTFRRSYALTSDALPDELPDTPSDKLPVSHTTDEPESKHCWRRDEHPSHLHGPDISRRLPYYCDGKPIVESDSEPQENEVPPADITGKEPVPVKDWDEPIVIEALLTGQADILLDEVNELEKSPSWAASSRKRIWRELDGIPADIAADTLAKARLDNLRVDYETEEERSDEQQ